MEALERLVTTEQQYLGLECYQLISERVTLGGFIKFYKEWCEDSGLGNDLSL